MVFDMSKMSLSPQQRERMIFLLGPRYNAKRGNVHEFKIVCDHFPSYQENYMRIMEQFREIYWESLRAPAVCATFNRNPYRREKLLKQMFGRTKEERDETKKQLNASLKEHINQVDLAIVEKEIKDKQDQIVKDANRKEVAAKREKLGFSPHQLDEDDKAIEYIELNQQRREQELQKPMDTAQYSVLHHAISRDARKHKK